MSKRKEVTVRWWIGSADNPDEREQIVINAEDAARHPAHGDLRIFAVKDLLTNKRVKLRRANCGLGCQCALERVK